MNQKNVDGISEASGEDHENASSTIAQAGNVEASFTTNKTTLDSDRRYTIGTFLLPLSSFLHCGTEVSYHGPAAIISLLY